MVNSPIVNGNAKLSTYGGQEIGEIPNSARTDNATPIDMNTSPVVKINNFTPNSLNRTPCTMIPFLYTHSQ